MVALEAVFGSKVTRRSAMVERIIVVDDLFRLQIQVMQFVRMHAWIYKAILIPLWDVVMTDSKGRWWRIHHAPFSL
jgi:hypothetical protein